MMNPYRVNLNEEEAKYMLIVGGNFVYSITGENELIEDFHMAKYPVTNKLYRRFINFLDSEVKFFSPLLTPGDYTKKLFKMAAGIEGFAEYLQRKTLVVDVLRSPCDNMVGFCEDDKPVVGVSWYAARAYCLWLSLLESDDEVTDLYRLPIEKEWEYVAAGKEGRKYPWGDEDLTPEYANYEINIGKTTPVKSYPQGATPTGVFGLAGNVSEWMENPDHQLSGNRPVRGGSWSGYPESLVCVWRDCDSPDLETRHTGFRVVYQKA